MSIAICRLFSNHGIEAINKAFAVASVDSRQTQERQQIG